MPSMIAQCLSAELPRVVFADHLELEYPSSVALLLLMVKL
jgi:hypothetical protein